MVSQKDKGSAAGQSHGQSGDSNNNSAVKVAVRVRPFNEEEHRSQAQACLGVEQGGSASRSQLAYVNVRDKAFAFDAAFEVNASQDLVFDRIARGLIDGCLDGYNATLLAYGQTGSGKTFTMGTCPLEQQLEQDSAILSNLQSLNSKSLPNRVGVLPRAIAYLFDCIESRRSEAIAAGQCPPEFRVSVQFVELYNEEVNDLLDSVESLNAPASPTRRPVSAASASGKIQIHEDSRGSIFLTGVSSRLVASLEETMRCLAEGAAQRVTAETMMNKTSSRSHAIFTVHVRQQRIATEDGSGNAAATPSSNAAADAGSDANNNAGLETLTAKFHFVDLAGSERLKRTGAVGDRAKEGISINGGLLALGNVISALGERSRGKAARHVPYRDSKLTRLLQDSLGGNSRTWMIACVSPADRDFVETLNTLKYASRARDIQNRVTVNQDKSSAVISELRRNVQLLEAKLLEFVTACRCGLRLDFSLLTGSSSTPALNNNANAVAGAGSPAAVTHVASAELESLRAEVERYKLESTSLSRANSELTQRNRQLAEQEVVAALQGDGVTNRDMDAQLEKMLIQYAQQREELHARVIELEAMRLVGLDGDLDIGSSWTARCTALSTNGISDNNGVENGDVFEADADADAIQDNADTSARLRRRRSLSTPCSIDLIADGDVEMVANSPPSRAETEAAVNENDNENDAENDADSALVTQEIAKVESQIAAREKLLRELRGKAVEMGKLRDVYERQIGELQKAISETQAERDRAVADLELAKSQSQPNDAQVDALREKFRRRLEDLEARHAALLEARAKNGRLMQENGEKEKQLKRLLSDLQATKKSKVALMRELESERNKARAASVAAKRTVDRLEKDKATLGGQVRTLQRAAEQKDALLKRKLEELETIRKQRRAQFAPKSNKRAESAKSTASASTTSSATDTGNANSSPVIQRLGRFENLLLSLIERRSRQQKIEQELTTWILEREQLANRLELTCQHLAESMCESAVLNDHDLTAAPGDQEAGNRNLTMTLLSRTRDASVLEVEIRSIRAQIDDAQERIDDCQAQLLTEALDVAQARPAEEPDVETDADRAAASSKAIENELERMVANSSPHELRALLELVVAKFCKLAASGSNIGASSGSSANPDVNNGVGVEQPRVVEQLALPPSIAGQYDVTNAFRLLNEAVDFVNRGVYESEAKADGNDLAAWRENARNLLQSATVNGELPPEDVASNRRRRTAVPTELQLDVDAQRLDVLMETSHDDDSGALSKASTHPLNSPRKARVVEDDPPKRRNRAAAAPRPSTLNNLRASSIAGAGNTLTRSNTMPMRMNRDASNASSSDSQIDSNSTPESPDPGKATVEATVSVTTGRRGKMSPSPSQVDATFTLLQTREEAPKSQLKNDGTMMGLFAAAGTLSAATFSAIHSNNTNAATKKRSNQRNSTESASSGAASEPGRFQTVQRTPTKGEADATPPALECTYELVGHRHSVLDCWYSDETNLLFTSGFDGVVKCWDIERCVERESIVVGASGVDQPQRDKVTHVRYSHDARALFCATADCVRLYDLRESGSKYVKAYFTNGAVAQSAGCFSADSRRHDTFVRGLSIADNYLFAAAGATLRVWDTRTDQLFPKLYCSQKVMTIHVHTAPVGTDAGTLRVVAGCKDHNVRVFETSTAILSTSTAAIQPNLTLTPPHCDGVEALVSTRDGCTLFSATRDACIRKWDVRDLAQPRVADQRSNAHADWIRGLALWEPTNAEGASYLLSCAKDGSLQLWNTGVAGHHKITAIKSVRAHSDAVNAVRVSRNGLAFTASNDRTARVWRVRAAELNGAAAL